MASRGCNQSKPWLLLSNFHQENHISNTFSHQIASKLDFKKIVEKNMLKGLLVIFGHKFRFLVDAIIPSQYFTEQDHDADAVNRIILELGTARFVAVYMASINTTITRDGSSYSCLLCALMAGMGRNPQILSLQMNARSHQLHSELKSIMKRDRTVTEYLARIQVIIDILLL